jgi:hypothetical protein
MLVVKTKRNLVSRDEKTGINSKFLISDEFFFGFLHTPHLIPKGFDVNRNVHARE